MAGGIAHEIRNPLAICSSAAQFMREDDISDEFRQECVEDIQAGIQKASMIIENMLRFARPTTRTDLQPVDVTPLLQETLQLISNQAAAHRIEVLTDFPSGPVRIEGIANLLQQVFVNLILNAIAAMPNGGTLRIRVAQTPSEVVVQMEDTGCGIPEADIGKVFDPFYTTAVSGKGTGLGLSICYAIVKEHRGTIDAQSIYGKGSSFSVRLPAMRDGAGSASQ
jgi:signal transduction histidine kinase